MEKTAFFQITRSFINNRAPIIEQQISRLSLKDHEALKTGIMMLEIVTGIFLYQIQNI